MIITLTEYRDILYPTLPIEHIGDMHFQLKLFDVIYKRSKDGFYKPSGFDLHHVDDDIKLFDVQDCVLQELVQNRLLYATGNMFAPHIINPKIRKYIEIRDAIKISGTNLN
jgi:hypothetical protein